jgi:hypothetical protein
MNYYTIEKDSPNYDAYESIDEVLNHMYEDIIEDAKQWPATLAYAERELNILMEVVALRSKRDNITDNKICDQIITVKEGLKFWRNKSAVYYRRVLDEYFQYLKKYINTGQLMKVVNDPKWHFICQGD